MNSLSTFSSLRNISSARLASLRVEPKPIKSLTTRFLFIVYYLPRPACCHFCVAVAANGIAVDLIQRFCAANGADKIIQRRFKGKLPFTAQLCLAPHHLAKQPVRQLLQRQLPPALKFSRVKAAAPALRPVRRYIRAPALQAVPACPLCRKITRSAASIIAIQMRI